MVVTWNQPRMAAHAMRLPGILLGVGLGGMLDGIVLHELLQWHSMLSQRVPLRSVEAMHVNMLADGVFHAAMWLFTVAGIAALWRAMQRPGLRYDAQHLTGAGLMGWGGFNLVEGLINHQLLGLHHVRQADAEFWPADMAFLASGVVLIAVGAWMRRGRS